MPDSLVSEAAYTSLIFREKYEHPAIRSWETDGTAVRPRCAAGHREYLGLVLQVLEDHAERSQEGLLQPEEQGGDTESP